MRALLISDISSDLPGGAQASNKLIIEKGKELGFDIQELNLLSSRLPLSFQHDVIISSNFEWFYTNNPYNDTHLILDKILNHPFHVRYEHDSCAYLSNQDRKTLYNSTKINFFLSDFHLKFFKQNYGEIFYNNEIVYDPIDTDIFIPKDCEKEYDVIYCGYAHELKGFNEFIKYSEKNLDKKIAFIGWFDKATEHLIPKLQNAKNITDLGRREPNEIPQYLQKTKYIFHQPNLNEPFCRMVAEGLLCGCELIGKGDIIGSYLEYQKHGHEKFKQKCSEAADTFWQKIKEKL
jgi:glycosyltransferase involved in cell wall biosynthesis